jgi:rhodanese-related sulfurtransferase
VFQTTLEEPNQRTPEITTEQLQAILAANSEPVFDVRTAEEYAIAHIPGTINIYELEVERITALYPDRSSPMILYCNGPSCGKSKRTSEQLVALGYTNVRRYQLGLPVWRALSLTVQTDLPGLQYIFTRDHTSVFVDARTPDEFAAATMPGAVNVQPGEAVVANEDGRLPFRDKAARIVVFGSTTQQAKIVASEIAKRAYWSSSYFGGTFTDLAAAGLINHRPVVAAKNTVLAAGSACSAVIAAGTVDNGSFDPDAGDTVSLSVSPEGAVGLGQHAVVLTGTDRHGLSAAASSVVEVTDQSAPSIGSIDAESGRLQRNGYVPVTLEYSTGDNCSSVTEQVTVSDWRGQATDAQVVDAHHLLLRPGRIYRVGVTARDAAGNQVSLTTAIRAPWFGH